MNLSVENVAESKYKYIKPWLLFSVGDGKINETISSRKKSASNSKVKTMRLEPVFSKIEQIFVFQTNVKDSSLAVSFNSIPTVCVLPKTHHIAASEFATPKYPVGRLQILDRKGNLINCFSTESMS